MFAPNATATCNLYLDTLKGLNVELLVHSEVNANELEFSGLSTQILFYKRVKWFKTFYDKIKPLIESKDSNIYFCNYDTDYLP